MYILGISAFYHDSAATIIKDGKIIAAAQEERFTRKKHDASFPTEAIKFCLDYAGIGIDDLDCVAFYDKPLLKFERLLETYYAFAPRGLKSFFASMPVWIREKLFLRKMIRDGLKDIDPSLKKFPQFLFPEHHLSHAASAFYPSPYDEAAVLTIDGVGEWATTTISHGKGKDLKILKEMNFPHSWGLLYSAFTYYLGFKVNSGEYKLMGLAPYGHPESPQTKEFIKKIKEHLIDLKEDGSLWLNLDYFEYPVGLKMTKNKKWEELFGFPVRKPESEMTQTHMNLGYAIQKVTEEGVIKLAREAKKITGAKYLTLAGGVALNCVANGKVISENIFEEIWGQPAAGDAGGSMGAALAAWHIYYGKERVKENQQDNMQGSYLGPEFSHIDIEKVARKYNAPYTKYDQFEKLCDQVASFLNQGHVVGWFQKRMEWGPRALGNRSILGDARNPEMQKKLNLKIKYRESFRPFAPTVLAEDLTEYFDLKQDSPYMMIVSPVAENHRQELPADYYNQSAQDRLYFLRSDLPAITHLDYSARIQTIHQETNPEYWQLLTSFKKQTGYSVLVNTSFNVRGEPIVCTPQDAYRCFMRTEMDYLILGDYVFCKSNQPKFEDDENWQEIHQLD